MYRLNRRITADGIFWWWSPMLLRTEVDATSTTKNESLKSLTYDRTLLLTSRRDTTTEKNSNGEKKNSYMFLHQLFA
jgi:hypothetical protein